MSFLCRIKIYFFIVYVPISEQFPDFPSITPYIPAAHWYEREIKDMFGLEPVGHPDPYTLVLHGNMPENTYPLRKDFDANTRLPHLESKLPFARVDGEGVFEIPVGPIHAGIIEPGHFRFSAIGGYHSLFGRKIILYPQGHGENLRSYAVYKGVISCRAYLRCLRCFTCDRLLPGYREGGGH